MVFSVFPLADIRISLIIMCAHIHICLISCVNFTSARVIFFPCFSLNITAQCVCHLLYHRHITPNPVSDRCSVPVLLAIVVSHKIMWLVFIAQLYFV
jgi:hypothetical protein